MTYRFPYGDGGKNGLVNVLLILVRTIRVLDIADHLLDSREYLVQTIEYMLIMDISAVFMLYRYLTEMLEPIPDVM